MTLNTASDTTLPPSLRDLDDAAFASAYDCDRLTASILGNRFRYVLAHVSTKLRANAFSPIIRDADDFCATISGPPELGWAMPAASLTNPVHWGPVGDSVGIVLDEIGVESLRPGDIVVSNDSFRTGKHLNDMSFIRPLFHDGRLMGAVHITAHQLDLGSKQLGGFDIASQSLWEDGLVLPPMMLYREGKPERSTIRLVAANSRFPELLLADFQVIRSSLELGERLLLESIERYGAEAYLGSVRYACDVAAEEMRTAFAALPDGDYDGRSIIDADGLPESPEYQVAVRMRKRGSNVEFDFSGTSAASRTSVNCSWLDVKTGVTLALKMLLAPETPPNSGALRDVDLLLPHGSFINPDPPAATMYYFSVVQAIMTATLNALNGAMGLRAIAGNSEATSMHRGRGTRPDGMPWAASSVEAAPATFPWGATQAGDADTFSLLCWMNFPVPGNEVAELHMPILVLRAEAAADTAGAGLNRGGAAQLVDTKWLYPGLHHQYTAQVKTPPPGAVGGHDGRLGGAWMFESAPDAWLADDLTGPLYRTALPVGGMIDPETNEPSPDGVYTLFDHDSPAPGGCVLRDITSSGGGWGNPLERDPQRVLVDVRDGYVTIEGAARDYGVIITGDPHNDPEGLQIDLEQTRATRANRQR